MKIQIEPHTLERAKERGATKEEIIETITNGLSYRSLRRKIG